MGTSQSTELKDGANVKDIIGSESRYSVFDLSSLVRELSCNFDVATDLSGGQTAVLM